PADVLQCLRQIPVEERGEGRDASLEQTVDETAVEIETARVRRTAPLRDHARPRDGETIRVQPDALHERHVVAPAMEGIARDVAVAAVLHLAGHRGETIPDRLAAPVLAGRALDLERGRRRAPDELVGKVHARHVAAPDGRIAVRSWT